MPRLALALLAFALGGGPAPAAGLPGVRVVAHPSAPVDSVSRDDLSRLFLKKLTAWPGGRAAVPVDLEPASALRAEFTRQVHRRSVDAVKRYWRQQIYSARDVPPPDRPTDAAVIAFVRATPGAVGYVSGAADLHGVKLLTVVDR